MTLDEAIEEMKYDTKLDCDINDMLEQLAEWLEELKRIKEEIGTDDWLKERDKRIRGKAIDDFAKLVEKWCWKHEQYNQDDLNELIQIAEQLKGGGVNE